MAYANHANTYKYRRHIIREFNRKFPLPETPTITEVKTQERLAKNTAGVVEPYTAQKTLFLLKKGYSPEQIAMKRSIQVGTVWAHIAELIEHSHLPLRKVLTQEKIDTILPKIHSEADRLKYIKNRLDDPSITFNEISCVLADVKRKNKKKSIIHLVKWYQRKHCYRKCYAYPDQRVLCAKKFDQFTTNNPTMQMKTEEFLHLFNNHIDICVLPEQEKRRFISWQEFIEKRQKRVSGD